MCGIIGYVGPRQAQPVILQGLKRLEYRGYDSAGIAVLAENGGIVIRRDVGKLQNLEAMLYESPLQGHIGIGHTRWATHGEPSQRNAHPHVGMNERVVVVHNGIVENYQELRHELEVEGIHFASDTDTEVIVQLLERYVESGMELARAAQETFAQLEGSNAVVAMSLAEPGRLVTSRLGNAGGITLGLGDGEMFIASDIPAIREVTDDGRCATLVPPGNSDALAEAVKRVLTDPDSVTAKTAAGRQRFETLYTIDRIADQMVDLMREVATTN